MHLADRIHRNEDIYSREEDNQRIKKQETYLKAHTFRLEQEQRWAAL